MRLSSLGIYFYRLEQTLKHNVLAIFSADRTPFEHTCTFYLSRETHPGEFVLGVLILLPSVYLSNVHRYLPF